LSRAFGIPKAKKSIEKAIKGRAKQSTKYIRVEINRTFLIDAIFIHSLLVDEGDLRFVYQRVRTFPVKPRQKDRFFAILETVSDKGQLRVDDAIVRLENLILGMEKKLLQDVKLMDTGTKCPLAEEELKFEYPYFRIKTDCTRNNPNCSLPDHIRNNGAQLEALHVDIGGNQNLQKLHVKLAEVLKNPRNARGRNCQILGDTIICLDAPQQSDVFSTNIRDFAPICKSLGRSFIGIEW
jgi:hypothetical protein